jgi:hypothetical protein
MQHFVRFFLKFKFNLLFKTRVFFSSNAGFAVTILYLNSLAHLASFIMLHN